MKFVLSNFQQPLLLTFHQHHIIVGDVQNSKTNDGQFRGSSSRNFRPRNVRNPQTSRIVCQLCGKMGHTAMKCFQHFDVYFQSPPRAQNQQFSFLHQPQQPQLQSPPLQPQMQPQSQPQYYSTGLLVPSRPIQNSHQQHDSIEEGIVEINFQISQLYVTANVNTTRIVEALITGLKVSVNSTPAYC